MGLSRPLGIARVDPAKRNSIRVMFWPYNKSFIDQACSVKMAGYWPRSFLRFYGPRLRLGLGSKKELGQYPAILTEQAWSITHIFGVKIVIMTPHRTPNDD